MGYWWGTGGVQSNWWGYGVTGGIQSKVRYRVTGGFQSNGGVQTNWWGIE